MKASIVANQSDLDHVSKVVEQLAVLLAAGIPPTVAWQYLADSSNENDHTPAIVRLVARASPGSPLGDVLLEALVQLEEQRLAGLPRSRRGWRSAQTSDNSAWRGLAAAWLVATGAGAPLAPGLVHFANSLRALAQSRRDASVALSGPVATAKLVLALPIVGILFGMALGFDTLGTLVATGPGLVCLTLGGLLLWVGRVWNRRLVAAATTMDHTPGLVLDLLAIAMSGGASLSRATIAVADAVERCGLPGRVEEADSVLSLASRAGVPASALLHSEADRVRREAKSEADRRAARLAVTLMIPLGLCVLPAFMLVGVAPLMIAVLSSTVSVF